MQQQCRRTDGAGNNLGNQPCPDEIPQGCSVREDGIYCPVGTSGAIEGSAVLWTPITQTTYRKSGCGCGR